MTTGPADPGKLVVLIANEELGHGPAELGKILMRSFLKTIKDLSPKPEQMIFLNSGVKLVAEGSDLLDDLAALSAQGTDLFACGTCLDYLHLKEKVKVGRISNMTEIAGSLLNAGRVVRP
jgi:selenium metabolism protein YedF